MKKFMEDDFLLFNDVSKKLYNDYAKNMPIIDYHCHVNPKEIAENVYFENITQLWLGGDHYKWRQMRSCGVDEKYITGDASDRDKFQKWAETLPRLIGNPLFHWSHLELKKYFGYEGILNGDTAEDVWNICNQKLKTMSVRDIIEMSNVELICTTDDPVDSLQYHKKIADSDFSAKVLPAWRPDKLLCIEKESFKPYIEQLAKISGIDIFDFSSLKKAITIRMDFFDSFGCNISDHGLSYVMYVPASEKEVNDIFVSALSGKILGKNEILKFKTACLKFMAEEYFKRNWVMQLHFGVMRDNNKLQLKNLGVDTGFDCIGDNAPMSQLAAFLNCLAENQSLPKTILYSLNPNDNAAIDALIGCFQDNIPFGRVQHGAAWWFNDHRQGITDHLTSLANLGVLSNFIGMLTDSRSFLSYTRHDYFRRILCEFIGNMVVQGAYPYDIEFLGGIVQDISYKNIKQYLEK